MEVSSVDPVLLLRNLQYISNRADLAVSYLYQFSTEQVAHMLEHIGEMLASDTMATTPDDERRILFMHIISVSRKCEQSDPIHWALHTKGLMLAITMTVLDFLLCLLDLQKKHELVPLLERLQMHPDLDPLEDYKHIRPLFLQELWSLQRRTRNEKPISMEEALFISLRFLTET